MHKEDKRRFTYLDRRITMNSRSMSTEVNAMVTELSPFFGVSRDFDRLLDGFFAPLTYSQRRGSYPPLNLSEDDVNLYVTMEVPGLPIEDLEITLTDSTLVIRGERKPEEGKYYRRERSHGVFQRVVNINAPVDRDKVKASLKDGVLEIALPKAEEFKPRKISIDS